MPPRVYQGYAPTVFPRKSTQKPLPRKNKGSLPTKLKKGIKKRPRRKVDKTQNAAIMKLSKQVKSLQLAKYGTVQMNYQQSVDPIFPERLRPIAIDITDFTCQTGLVNGCRYWQGSAADPNQIIGSPCWKISDQATNPFWQNVNDDYPSGGAYLPEYVKVTLRFQSIPSVIDTRIRVDLVQQRQGTTQLQTLAERALKLPDSLQHLKELAVPTTGNRINPEYFKIYQTKWLYFNSRTNFTPPTGQPILSTTQPSAFMTFIVRPKKLRTQFETNPVAEEPVNEVNGGNFGPLNTDPSQALYMIISTDDQPGPVAPGRIQCTMSRVCRWRDTIGSSKVAN